MGLDMYLYTNSKKVSYELNKDGVEWEETYQAPHGIAVYWRKANMVHKWFVDNVQGGNDDCGTYDVTVEDLCRLHDVCKAVLDSTELVDGDVYNGRTYENGKMVDIVEAGKVLKDSTVAKELLPSQSGFFFGATNYDQWYWWDVQYTQRKLEQLLDMLEPAGKWGEVAAKGEPDWYVTFQYHSSW